MRPTTRRLIITAALLLAAAPALSQVKDHRDIKAPPLRPFDVPEPSRLTLPNGMVVMLLEDHELPLVELIARIRTGAIHEPAGKVGLAGIFGDVLRTGGTKSMTGDAIDDFLERRAASIETGVGDDSGFATLSCLRQDFPDVLKLFADILRNPVFAEEKIRIARTEATTLISRRNDEPNGIMAREFGKLVYGADNPYARTEEYATIESISRDDLIAWHAKHVHPDRVLLGVVGDFNTKEMTARLKAAFGDWPKGPESRDPQPASPAPLKPGFSWVPKEDMTQSNIIMGHLGIRRDDPDFFAVEVLNEVFGGGFAARLFSNVRSRKGLAYRVRGGVGAEYGYPGLFTVSMTTKTETTAAGIDALREEIDGLFSNPPSEEEVRRAKEAILSSFVFNFDSRAKILGQQLTYAYHGFPADYLARYRDNIDKVTPADVARVAKRLIQKDRMAVLVVGPSKGQDRPLASFGPVTRLDITIPEPRTAAAPAASGEALAKGKTLFAKVVDALGGAAAVDAVTSIRNVTSVVQKTPQGEFQVKATYTLSLPDRVRQDLELPMGKAVLVVTGSEAFQISPMGGGAQPLADSRRGEISRSLRRQPIVMAQHRKDSDFQVSHAGQDAIDGAPLEILSVSYAGDEFRIMVEPATGRIVRIAFRGQGPSGPGDSVITFSDFRAIGGGVTLPFKSETTFNGERQASSASEEITINVPVDAALFQKPEPAPAAARDGQ